MIFNKLRSYITSDQIEKFKKLAFTAEELEIINSIENSVAKYTRSLKVFGIMQILSIVINVYLFMFIDNLSWNVFLQRSFIYFVIVFNLVIVLIGVFYAGKHVNIYKRTIGGLLDNLLSLILEDYRISLAHISSVLPKPKEFSQKMSDASLDLFSVINGLSHILGMVFIISSAFIISLVLRDPELMYMSFIGFVIVISFLVLIGYGIRFSKKEKEFQFMCDRFDSEFKASRSLLVRSNINLAPVDFHSGLEKVVEVTTIINFISKLVYIMTPVLLIAAPILIQDGNTVFRTGYVGMYFLSLVYGQTGIVSRYYSLAVARVRLSQIDVILNTIFENKSELTPNKYLFYQRKYRKDNPTTPIVGEILGGDLQIVNLKYVTGREDSENLVYVDNLNLKAGKVHFLFGSSGIGKSIFGRVLTLRYTDFSAKHIYMGDVDIRTFSSLDRGLSFLRFSGLRNIETSYRHAMSVYLNYDSESLLFERIVKVNASPDSLRKYYYKHRDYYGDNYEAIMESINRMKMVQDTKPAIRELVKVRECYKNKLKDCDDLSVLGWAMKLEYFSFHHLLNIVPEATLYFMDAVLSEPPISQGQRRRVLLALDLLVYGIVFVADEPFANLDKKSAFNVLTQLSEYANMNNAVVLVLDQEERLGKNALRKIRNMGQKLEFIEKNEELYIVSKQ